MIVFPTRYKSKLPQTLSYPVGAELISSALQDVPQSNLLDIGFYWGNRAGGLQRQAEAYKFFLVQYKYTRPSHSSSNHMIKNGWYKPKWGITVYAALRPVRHIVKKLMKDEGFPKVHAWLNVRGQITEEETIQTIAVLFDETDERLLFEEHTHA